MSDELNGLRPQIGRRTTELVARYSPQRLDEYLSLGRWFSGAIFLILISVWAFIYFLFEKEIAYYLIVILIFGAVTAGFIRKNMGDIEVEASNLRERERHSNNKAIKSNKETIDVMAEKIDRLTRELIQTRYADPAQLQTETTDFFISHASEDKDAFVRPLALKLIALNCSVFYDEFTMRIGDSLRKKIDDGLRSSKFGIVVLSKNFFVKGWTNLELSAMVSREVAGKMRILPIRHGISADEVADFSPLLADKLSLDTQRVSLDQIASDVASLLRRDL